MEGNTLHDQILIFLLECPVLGLVSNDARSHESGDHFVDMNWFPAIRLMVTRSLRASLHYGGEGLRSVKNAWPRHGYMRQMVDVPEKN
jgi:hypothetical protein